MRQAAELTGQSRALSEVLLWLDEPDGSRSLTIEGPPGSGKSWLVSELEPRSIRRPNRVFVYATGDSMNVGRSLLPLAGALARSQRVGKAIKAGAVAGARGSPFGTGALLSLVLETALNWRERDQNALTPFLTTAERDVLVELQLRVGGGELVLVLENLQWWDDVSLGLLKLMLQHHLHRAFPFLSRTRFIGVLRSEPEAGSKMVAEVRKLLGSRVSKLAYCAAVDFKELLSSLGMSAMPTDADCEALHGITRGHLGLALEIARLGPIGGSTLVAQAGRVDLDHACAHLMAIRLEQLGERGLALADLLAQAAAIGLSFSRTEITCLIDGSALDLAHQMRDAAALELVSVEGDAYAFHHDLVQRYFADRLTDTDRDVHARFAECLRKIRPGQYEARRRHLALAGDSDGAAVMSVHAGLALAREGRLTAERRLELVEHAGPMASFADLMIEAMRLVDDGDYRDCLRLLEGIDLVYSPGLLAERAIIAARCSIKLLTRSSCQDALRVLAEASGVRDVEPEVWSRVMLTRVVAQVYAEDVEAARQMAFELGRWAEQRKALDPDAARILHRLKVKADLYLVPEVAAGALNEARAYFGPAHGQDSVRDPINYFITLTNLSANQFVLNDCEHAYATALKANEFLQRSRKAGDIGTFPRMDMHVNNLLVAGFRSDQLTAQACIDAFDGLLANAPETNDRPLLESNRSVIRVLAGGAVKGTR